MIHHGLMPRTAQPAGYGDAEVPTVLLGSMLKAGIIRYLRAHPDALMSEMCESLELVPSTVRPPIVELQEAGLVLSDPPSSIEQSRRGMRVRYRVNDEAVTDVYLRLGMAIGEF